MKCNSQCGERRKQGNHDTVPATISSVETPLISLSQLSKNLDSGIRLYFKQALILF